MKTKTLFSLLIITITILSISEQKVYNGMYNVDSIEDGIITLIRKDHIRILLAESEYPHLTEGIIIDCNYRIDIDETAQLRNRIEILQITLLERSKEQ